MLTSIETLKRVEDLWDHASPVAGQMFQRRLPAIPGAAHFAVRLSADHVIAWCPLTAGQVWARGCFTIDSYSADFRRVRDVQYLRKNEILLKVAASIHCFHDRWDYCVRGWNCEHWARLVSCGEPISFQARELFFSVATIAGGHFRNPDATKVLEEAERAAQDIPLSAALSAHAATVSGAKRT